MQYDVTHHESGRWCVATLSITVCACHVQWYTQRGTECPHTDPHSHLVGVQCILAHPVLVYPSFPTTILRKWPQKDISDANILTATTNEGRGGNNRDFIMARNRITAPLHTTTQAQPSVCKIIPFCVMCGSNSSVDEDSSLLVYYTELIGKMLLMCQSSMLPPSKGEECMP